MSVKRNITEGLGTTDGFGGFNYIYLYQSGDNLIYIHIYIYMYI